ncbi:hypothetical protein KY285_021847 [Solanum tuberosum]|nr:hypothetical protein KY285_021847 [Solanum tuberosum]KAH0707335.1 hypothetical protein KY289_012411 [Solanum tuberosum]
MRVHVDGRRGKWWLKLNSLSLSRLQPVARPDSQTLLAPTKALRPRPQVRRDYPLSLSISISGGKETYKDSLSNGERTGNSPALESGGSVVRIVVWRSVLSGGPGPSPLEGGAREGESPVVPGPCRTTRRCLRVGLFGNAAQIGR